MPVIAPVVLALVLVAQAVAHNPLLQGMVQHSVVTVPFHADRMP